MQNDEALRGAIHRVGMFARVIDDNGCSMDDERGTELAADLRLVLSALSKVSPTPEEVARVIDKLAWTDPGPDDGPSFRRWLVAGWTEYQAAHPGWNDDAWKAADDAACREWRVANGHEEATPSFIPEDRGET